VVAALGLSARTLRTWRALVAAGPTPRGRPPHQLTEEEQTMIDLVLLDDGPGVSLAALHTVCPGVPRAMLRALRVGVRRACRAAQAAVTWTRAGRVWALDWCQPTHPIDGHDRAIVHLRDLASGYRLAVVPIARATTAALLAILRTACAQADAPLVLKLDNGGPCRSQTLRAWATAHGIALLYSPPYWPPYNGSIEASIGALATRADLRAAGAGHPAYWTADDLAHVCAQANAASDGTDTPAARWAARPPITHTERRRFVQALATTRRALARATTPAYSAAMRDRLALVRTLQTLGYVRMVRSGEFVH
jgi:hypothetical protein